MWLGRLMMVISCIALGAVGCSRTGSTPAGSWDPKTAAAYLDRRMEWWMGWKGSRRDHDTFCVSCHTALPYALARPWLRTASAAQVPAVDERRLADDVTQRVRLWSQTQPYYTDQKSGLNKSAQSRGTEAVLNALLLACAEARGDQMGGDARAALESMWKEQKISGNDAGAWSWLNFELAPWEVASAQYYGAAMAAMAAGTAPGDYQTLPGIQDNMRLLRGYLEQHYAVQSLHNRLELLWASTRLRGLVAANRRASIIEQAVQAQNPDGGWSTSGLIAPSSEPGLQRDPASDGYATGLVVLVMEQAGVSMEDTALQRGLNWLDHHQNPEGFWAATSLNKPRALSTPAGWFMRDAATAYAVMALSESPQHAKRP
jgi:squalene-hopene/tetraprenyl-beta-curcumene cyclase